jgi:hypothetical protein
MRTLGECYYDRAGKPITMEEWAALLGDHDYRRVAFDKIGDVEASTVWLGLDMSHHGTAGIVFETMVFGGDALDQECERYSSEEQAVLGHVAMLERVREASK